MKNYVEQRITHKIQEIVKLNDFLKHKNAILWRFLFIIIFNYISF